MGRSENRDRWRLPMAAFRQHVTFSTVLGLGYSMALKGLGWGAGDSLLAGALCGLAGMLPGFGSENHNPLKKLCGPAATANTLFSFVRFRGAGRGPPHRILLPGCSSVPLRFGVV